jgi:hypothetical protein
VAATPLLIRFKACFLSTYEECKLEWKVLPLIVYQALSQPSYINKTNFRKSLIEIVALCHQIIEERASCGLERIIKNIVLLSTLVLHLTMHLISAPSQSKRSGMYVYMSIILYHSDLDCIRYSEPAIGLPHFFRKKVILPIECSVIQALAMC